MSKILVVDDEPSICWGLTKLGQSMGYEVQAAACAEEGLSLALKSEFDLLVLDVRLPGMDGLTAIEHFREKLGDIPIIVITAFGALEVAVEAVRSKAFEYINKPFDLEDMRSAIQRALQSANHTLETLRVETHGEMVGSTPGMQSLFKSIALAASSDANVLVTGESGVGKELAARAIHAHSSRSEAEFVAVNIAALSPTLVESELFGHVSGAYTGANQLRDGLLVEADGGTLFLDEVADIPLPVQVKLLRAIEQGEVLPVGADKPVQTNFRVVAATHQNLPALVQRGKFRHDLFYRICAYEMLIPPLRERVEDIPRIATYFVSCLSGGELTLSNEAFDELKRRAWYGNVRELRNAIEHASVVARRGIVFPEHLPQPQQRSEQAGNAGDSHSVSLAEATSSRSAELLEDPQVAGAVYDTLLQEIERPLLENAMERFDHECAPAARVLGLHRTTLKKKLVQHKLTEQ